MTSPPPRAGRADVRAADLAICHLETPVAPPGGPYRGYPSFAVQPQIVDALAGAGYDLCSTASNHSVATGDVLIHQDLRAHRRRPPARRQLRLLRRARAGGADDPRRADLAICHLETPVAPAGRPLPRLSELRRPAADRRRPRRRRVRRVLDRLQPLAGRRHRRRWSARSTTLDAAGIGHAGTYRTQAESLQPTILDVHGIKVGHIAATYGLNGGGPPADRAVGGGRRARAGRRAACWPRPPGRGRPARRSSSRACTAASSTSTTRPPRRSRPCARCSPRPTSTWCSATTRTSCSRSRRSAAKWVAYGLGNFVAEMARQGDPYDEVAARFTFTRGADGRFTVTKAEAIPLHVDVGSTAPSGWCPPTRRPSSGWRRCSAAAAPSRRGWQIVPG